MSSDPTAPKLVPFPRRPREPPPRRRTLAQPAPSPLPRPLTSLIGRETEVAAGGTLLHAGEVRWVSLTGPGGVGKTRLALRVAEERAASFPDGVVFVPLAPITDPALVLPAVVRALGLREHAGHRVAEVLARYLRQRRLLLVLDNLEQVAAAAPHLAALLEGCPGVKVLATSRIRLRVSGEHRFPVSPLSLPDDGEPETGGASSAVLSAQVETIAAAAAVQLFVARARAVEPGFALDADTAPTVAAICRRLDGLPLAIELAAVQLRFFTVSEVLARLEPALPLLTEGPTDAPDRLRTMRNAIAWSYALLPPLQQMVLRHLAVFVEGCSLGAAEAVIAASPPPAAAPRVTGTAELHQTLAALVDASLVQRHDAGGETRLRLLETIREFAWGELVASGEVAAVSTRHAAWCIQQAEGVRRSGALSRREGLATLETEHPNLRAALGWLLAQGEVTAALHLAGELAEFWFRHGHLAEGRAWLKQALVADDGPPTAARATALVGLSMLLWWRDDFDPSNVLLRDAEAVARAARDAGALAYARLHQGYVAFFRGDLNIAAARATEGLTTAAAIPQAFSVQAARWLLAEVALAQGEDELAREHFTELLGLARAGDDEISLANALAGLATLAEHHGEPGAALTIFADAMVVCQECGDHTHAAYVLEQAAATLAASRRAAAAVRLFAAADALRVVTEPEAAGIPYRHEQVLRTARETLGEDSFATLWASGASLSLDEAIAETRALAAELTEVLPTPRAAHATADHPLPAPLTAREREVLRLLVAGNTDKEIAAALGISRYTVAVHVAAIRSKLDAPSRTAAVAIAVRDGLV